MMVKTKKKDLSNKKFVDLKHQLTRALADYDNLRKRVEKEKEGYVKFANFDIVEKLLPVLDMFEGAQKHLQDSGLALAIQEFVDTLYNEGVERMKVEIGGKFNEKMHEAVEAVEVEGKKKGEVVEEVLAGWKFREGYVIRPAKVKVAGKEIKKGIN